MTRQLQHEVTRHCRLWCSTRREHVTTNLKRLVKFGITIYGKAWFEALKHPSIVDGPRVFHRLVVSVGIIHLYREGITSRLNEDF